MTMKPVDERWVEALERQNAIAERQLALAEGAAERETQSLKLQAEQLKQTRKRSNEVGPEISAFNPRGEKDFPMPKLKCEVSCPWPNRPEWHSFTREEVELWNLVEPGQFQIEKMDGSVVEANVIGARNTTTGKLEALELVGAYDTGEKRFGPIFPKGGHHTTFPPLTNMLRQILAKRADLNVEPNEVMTMKREEALIATGELTVSQGA